MNIPKPYQPDKPAQKPEIVPVNYSVPTTTDKDSWTTKEKIVYSLLAALGVGGTIWLGRKIVLGLIANKEENKSFDDGSSATIAKQIKMAFENDGWWGTNIEALREALTSVASQQDWNKIVKSYNKLYNSNLLKDLADELQSTEYNEMLQIINAKPLKKGDAPQSNQYKAWAKRLKAAFDKSYGFLPGTDEAAITSVMNEIPTQAAFIQVGAEFKKLYGTNVLEDMKAESEGSEYNEWLKIIIQKRKK